MAEPTYLATSEPDGKDFVPVVQLIEGNVIERFALPSRHPTRQEAESKASKVLDRVFALMRGDP